MKFQKGQSGNPGGRPKAEREVIELARDASPRAIGKLVELIDSKDERVSIAASNSVLERAFGKPSQPLANDPDNPITPEAPSVEALALLSKDDRAAIRHILGNALGRSEGDKPPAGPSRRARKPR